MRKVVIMEWSTIKGGSYFVHFDMPEIPHLQISLRFSILDPSRSNVIRTQIEKQAQNNATHPTLSYWIFILLFLSTYLSKM